MKSARRRLVRIGLGMVLGLALLGGLLHVPSIQRFAVLKVSEGAEDVTGLRVELGGIRLAWWKGQVELQELQLSNRAGEVLLSARKLGVGRLWKSGDTWHASGVEWLGGTLDLDPLLAWVEELPSSQGPSPSVSLKGLTLADLVITLPASLVQGVTVVAVLDGGAFTLDSTGWASSAQALEVAWDDTPWEGGQVLAGSLALRNATLGRQQSVWKVRAEEVKGFGLELAGEALWSGSGLPEGTLNWAYHPGESGRWWAELPWDLAQNWWVDETASGQISATQQGLRIPFATLPAGISIASPLQLNWPADSSIPRATGALAIQLTELRDWLNDHREMGLPDLPWASIQRWLGNEPTAEITFDPNGSGRVDLLSESGRPRASATLENHTQQATIELLNFEPAAWNLPGPRRLDLNLNITAEAPLAEATSYQIRAALKHRDADWPLTDLSGTGTWNALDQVATGRLRSAGKELPFSANFEARNQSSVWDLEWQGELEGLAPFEASEWALHGAWSGALHGLGSEEPNGRISLRNLVLLNGGRPITFERLDLIAEWNGALAAARWESDLGTGQITASTDPSAWKRWADAIENRAVPPSTPHLQADLQIRRFAPVALILGLPLDLSDGARLSARTRADGFQLAASIEQLEYDGWRAEGISLHADGWNRELYVNLAAEALKEGEEVWARNATLDLHGDSIWAADLEWTGWGDAPTRLRLEANEFDATWDLAIYEASVPWLDGRLELADVPAQLTFNPKDRGQWTLRGFNWVTPGARLEISGAMGNGESDGIVVEATLNSLPEWKGLEGWPLELDSAHIVLEACNLLDQIEWTSNGEVLDVKWGEAGVERITWNARGNLEEVECWWEAGPEDLPFLRGSGKLPLSRTGEVDLQVTSRGLPLEWVNPLMPPGTVELKGGVNGWGRMTGPYSAPSITGTLATDDAEARIGYLGVTVSLQGVAKVQPDHFAFDDWRVYDDRGNAASLTGTIVHHEFQEWNFDLSLDANQSPIHLLELTRNDNDLFYGSAFVRGDANVSGFANNLVMEARLESEPGTRFALPLDAASDARYADFIAFKRPEEEEASAVARDLSRVRLDLALDIDEDAEARIIFDESVGDEITGKTKGAINLTIDDFERFSMTGQLEVIEGSYLFTLQNVINKRFTLLPGGTVTWFGDPYAAEIDLDAQYDVRTALDPLLPLETNLPGRSKVQLRMGLQGNLMRPDISFDVNVPEVETRLQALVESALINEEELNRQVMGLLVLQQFLSPDPTSAIGTTGLQERSTEFLASQIGFWLSQMTQEVNVGVDYGTSATSGEQALAVALSAQLLDDRLHVEGAVGTNHLFGGTTEDLQVQDIRIRYDLPPDGTFQVTGYTTTNPVVTGQTGSSTQGVGLLMQSEFNSFRELWERIWGRNERAD